MLHSMVCKCFALPFAAPGFGMCLGAAAADPHLLWPMQGQPNQVADIAHAHGQVVMTLCSAWFLQRSCVYHYFACLCVIAQQACTYMCIVLKNTVSMNRRSPTVPFQQYSTNRSYMFIMLCRVLVLEATPWVCFCYRASSRERVWCDGLITCTRIQHQNTPKIRPISLLTLPLLTLLGSNFPGNPLWAWELHRLESNCAWVEPSELNNVCKEICDDEDDCYYYFLSYMCV